MIEQHLSTQEVCLFLGISLSTFYRYCKRGLLKPSFLTSGGHRRFCFNQLQQAFKIENKAALVVCYSRVSTQDQKKDLVTQEQKLLSYAKTLNNIKSENIISILDLWIWLKLQKERTKTTLGFNPFRSSKYLDFKPQRQIVKIWLRAYI